MKYISTELRKSSLASSLRSKNPTRYLVMHGITWDGDAEREKVAREWAETSVTELKKMEGWVRTTTFRGIDILKVGLGIPEGPETQKMPISLTVHTDGFLTPEAAESYAKQVAGHTNSAPKVSITRIEFGVCIDTHMMLVKGIFM
ncbi:hypothetical protein D9758_016850 [Tetrapyrgos nigripes]|uniref:Uncharacterized protein n=1 Tax=Tetrapyrgos nigripes TaxID=182062 RepID=A0A8H5CFJ3_9AGAR|nr:hypothetical protein D9758_016850 [Tetrapyrgos nigripes]